MAAITSVPFLCPAANQLRGFFKIKECLHPLASPKACDKVIASHTIQRKGPLQSIVDETGHCLTFYPPIGRESIEPQRRGWREASTFAGFCAKHDGPTFAALETVNFTGSAEQVFLIAYRAECHELYQKQASDRSHDPMRQLVDRGRDPSDQRAIQEMQAQVGASVHRGLADARYSKARMDKELLESRFDGFERLFIQFNGEVSVVSTGAVTPNRTISGGALQVFSDDDVDLERLYIGVVGDNDSAAVVLAWRKEDRAPAEFIAELVALPVQQVASMVVQFMFAYVENTYFSSAWWRSLPEPHQTRIRRLAQMGDPYFSKWSYIPDLHVPWNLTSVSDAWLAG